MPNLTKRTLGVAALLLSLSSVVHGQSANSDVGTIDIFIGGVDSEIDWAEVQSALAEKGLYSGAIDGVRGPATERSLIAYYRAVAERLAEGAKDICAAGHAVLSRAYASGELERALQEEAEWFNDEHRAGTLRLEDEYFHVDADTLDELSRVRASRNPFFPNWERTYAQNGYVCTIDHSRIAQTNEHGPAGGDSDLHFTASGDNFFAFLINPICNPDNGRNPDGTQTEHELFFFEKTDPEKVSRVQREGVTVQLCAGKLATNYLHFSVPVP